MGYDRGEVGIDCWASKQAVVLPNRFVVEYLDIDRDSFCVRTQMMAVFWYLSVLQSAATDGKLF